MTDKDFVELFNKQKRAFLKDFARGNKAKAGLGVPSDHKLVLDWFERWLRGENIEEPRAEQAVLGPVMNFDEFLDEVLLKTKEYLWEKNINMIYSMPGQTLGISESWKCIKVYGNNDVYYRIGKTKPRKGPRKGEDLLVLDLVMDGYKKQVFTPILEYKKEMESKLGFNLERELPKVEATGKYRLKVYLPFELAQQGDIHNTARTFANFVEITKPLLNSLGIV